MLNTASLTRAQWMLEEGEESAYLNMKRKLCQASALVLGEGLSLALHCGTPVQSQGDALQPMASNKES